MCIWGYILSFLYMGLVIVLGEWLQKKFNLDKEMTRKCEHIATAMSWLICYFSTLMEKEGILMIARNIPFTIPFCVPVDLLTGAIGIVQGLISTIILLVFSTLVIMVSGRIYKGIVLYTGQKLTFKNILGILKNK